MLDNFTPAMLELFASSLWETLVMVGIVLFGMIGIDISDRQQRCAIIDRKSRDFASPPADAD